MGTTAGLERRIFTTRFGSTPALHSAPAECRLGLSEAKAPQPDHDLKIRLAENLLAHDVAQSLHLVVEIGVSTDPLGLA